MSATVTSVAGAGRTMME